MRTLEEWLKLKSNGKYQVRGRNNLMLGTFDNLEEAEKVASNYWERLILCGS